MATIHLTVQSVAALVPREVAYTTYDLTVRKFGCRTAPGGTKSWVVEYRANGGGRKQPTKRVTIGRVGELSPGKARDKARTILATVSLGGDPSRDLSEQRQAKTVAELVEQYMAEEVRPILKPRTVILYDGYFNLHVLPALGIKIARDVTRSDIAKLHRKIGEKAKPTANRVVALLGGLYAWAVRSGELPDDHPNPARHISLFEEQAKERFLSVEEFARLGDALREAETVGLPWSPIKTTSKHLAKAENQRTNISPFATAAIRLLLFTGCRLSEILNLRWSDVDFERQMLNLADSKTGKKPVILAAPALAVLSSLPRLGEVVLPGNDPDQPRHDLQKPWRAIVRRAGLTGLRIHDLRHSFASVGAGSNLGLPVIGKLLGHRNAETTERYAHLADDPLKVAANSIAATIAAGLGEAQKGKVIELNKRR